MDYKTFKFYNQTKLIITTRCKYIYINSICLYQVYPTQFKIQQFKRKVYIEKKINKKKKVSKYQTYKTSMHSVHARDN